MDRKEYEIDRGKVVYWISDNLHQNINKQTLVFLPGLLAEHNLFNEQIKYFEPEFNCFTWDAPAHAESRPYSMDFTLKELAEVLYSILQSEYIANPVLIGHSFGAYIGQVFMELYPDSLSGFVSLNSAPIQKKYYNYYDLWFLRSMEIIYHFTPNLKSLIILQCSNTQRGRKNMKYALSFYSRTEMCKLAGNGFLSVYHAIHDDLPYKINCPALIICGKQDKSIAIRLYNAQWSKQSGIHIEWVENAGHNVNIDQPEIVNQLIYDFIDILK